MIEKILHKYEATHDGDTIIILETKGPRYRVFFKSNVNLKNPNCNDPKLPLEGSWAHWAWNILQPVLAGKIKPFWSADEGFKLSEPPEVLKKHLCNCEERLVLDHGCQCGGI